jgi:hypothetical protein
MLAAALAAVPEAATPERLTLAVARESPGAPVYAGEPAALRIVLRNNTAGPLMLPDWEHFPVVNVSVLIAGYPGASGKGERAVHGWEPAALQKSDFRELPAGETTVARTFTALLPGQASVEVRVTVPAAADAYRSLADGKTVRVENAWTGDIAANLTVDVPAAISPSMKARYDRYRERLADPLVPAEQKGRLLVGVAGEKHYFAARLLRETAEGLKPGPMRDAATGCLLGLAKFGSGYEAIPLLVQAMNDPNVAQPTREDLLAWAADAILAKGVVAVNEQAWYVWPEALLKSARQAIEQMTKDRNPYLGQRAKDALRRIDAPPGK